MKLYTIIGGANGVRKSNFAYVLKGQRSYLGQIIDVDKLNAQLGGDAITGGKASIRRIDACLEKGISLCLVSGRSAQRRWPGRRLCCASILCRP